MVGRLVETQWRRHRAPRREQRQPTARLEAPAAPTCVLQRPVAMSAAGRCATLRPAHPRRRGETVPLLAGVLMALGREVHRPQRLNSEEPGPPLSSPRGSHRAGYYLVGDHPMCDVVSHRAGPAVCASHSTTASGIRTVPLLVSDFQSTRNPLLEAGPGPVRASWTPSS